jgi:hypothetical protein
MREGREATLCPKCSQDRPDRRCAACLQCDRGPWVPPGLWSLFGFASYMIELAVERSPERARIPGVNSLRFIVAIYMVMNKIEQFQANLPHVILIPKWNYIDMKS